MNPDCCDLCGHPTVTERTIRCGKGSTPVRRRCVNPECAAGRGLTFGPMPRDVLEKCLKPRRWETRLRRIRKIAGAVPLACVLPFTMGVELIEPQDDAARAVLTRMCPPGDDHTWSGDGLLVEQRYANNLVEALRERGVYVP